MALASQLVAGRRPWRDEDRWLAMTSGWVAESIAAADSAGHALAVAVDDADDVAGFVTLSTRTHFTGDVDAYVGELVVAPAHRREGVGRALIATAETWARSHGFRTLTLDTGGANQAARALYDATGFEVEDVRLTKLLG
jgi:ribosomal protein S18 acetylase RimI-like enzyme